MGIPREKAAHPTGGNPQQNSSRLYVAAYEEGKRLVDDQIAELDSMRQRSVQFLAFVGSATAFLVAAGIRTDVQRTDLFFALASAATVISLLSIIAALSILLGWVRGSGRQLVTRAEWRFRLSPEVLIKDWIEPDLGAHGEDRFFRDIALTYEAMETANERALRRVRRNYLIFLVLGSMQVVLWATLVWACA